MRIRKYDKIKGPYAHQKYDKIERPFTHSKI